MSKIGRNEPCPCGSGRKYKKCCINKSKSIDIKKDNSKYLNAHWEYEEVKGMSTADIIKKLEDFGIPFEKDDFLKSVDKYYSAEELSESWFKQFKITARGKDEDFPWFSAWILWERFAPPHILSMEQMSDMIVEGFEYLPDDPVRACDKWLEVWEAIKYKNDPKYKNMDFINKQYSGSFFVSNLCQDLELELYNAGVKDKAYFEKRVEYCKDFLKHFPEEKELTVYNMRRTIAETYSHMGKYSQAESEYKKLVQEYPQNPWGYIGWGDLYFYDMKKEFTKARKFYEKALSIAKDSTDMIAAKERLEDLDSTNEN